FVVDDAIVVLENITRYLEAGDTPLAAALRGAREIGFTVLSMSVSLVAVFIPILLMGGLVGRLFREFAVVLATAILVSLLISLSTTPMMCAKFLKSQHQVRHGRLYRSTERLFDMLLAFYTRTLGWALRHQRITLAVMILTMAVNVYLFINVPKGFFPQQDTGRLIGNIQAEQDISSPAMREKMAEFVKVVKDDPAVSDVVAFTGGDSNTTNTGRVFVSLKPTDMRTLPADRVIEPLRGKLAHVP